MAALCWLASSKREVLLQIREKKTFLDKFVSKFSTGNKFWREGERGGKKFIERDIKKYCIFITTAQESETLCIKL